MLREGKREGSRNEGLHTQAAHPPQPCAGLTALTRGAPPPPETQGSEKQNAIIPLPPSRARSPADSPGLFPGFAESSFLCNARRGHGPVRSPHPGLSRGPSVESQESPVRSLGCFPRRIRAEASNARRGGAARTLAAEKLRLFVLEGERRAPAQTTEPTTSQPRRPLGAPGHEPRRSAGGGGGTAPRHSPRNW